MNKIKLLLSACGTGMVYSLECGCVIIRKEKRKSYKITYCPNHGYSDNFALIDILEEQLLDLGEDTDDN